VRTLGEKENVTLKDGRRAVVVDSLLNGVYRVKLEDGEIIQCHESELKPDQTEN
jgi:translation initiation factor IF-1